MTNKTKIIEQMIKIAIKEYRQKKIDRKLVRKRVKLLWRIRTELKEYEKKATGKQPR